MDMDAKEFEELFDGRECVAVRQFQDKLAMLFDNGVILFVSDMSNVAVSHGLAWNELWDEIVVGK